MLQRRTAFFGGHLDVVLAGRVDRACVPAQDTVTFLVPKVAFFCYTHELKSRFFIFKRKDLINMPKKMAP
jgi:hypothetical protein